MRTFLIYSYDTVWGSPQFQNRMGVSILHKIILYEKKMEAIRVIWIEGKVIIFFYIDIILYEEIWGNRCNL